MGELQVLGKLEHVAESQSTYSITIFKVATTSVSTSKFDLLPFSGFRPFMALPLTDHLFNGGEPKTVSLEDIEQLKQGPARSVEYALSRIPYPAYGYLTHSAP